MAYGESGKLPTGTFHGQRTHFNLSRLEKMRVQALEEHSLRRYAQLCEELGVEPEDTELYEQGFSFLNHDFSEPEKIQTSQTIPVVHEKAAKLLHDRIISHGFELGNNRELVERCFRDAYGNRKPVEGMPLSKYSERELVKLGKGFLAKCNLPTYPDVD
jgi:hypothetical protein